jgi:group I intron endonuclease
MALKCKHSPGNGIIYIQIYPHGKKYIGQTISVVKRFQKYERHEGNNPHHTNALKKYGYDNVKVLTFDVPEFLLDCVETSLISLYDTTDRTKGYNKMSGGSNGRPNQETIEKMRAINSDGRHKGENNVMYGKKHKPETIELFKRQRIGRPGHKHTPESIEKFRRSGEAHHSYGKKASEETKKKQSIARTGLKRTKETKEKISQSTKGFKHPRARAVYAFGNWYGSCGVASDALRFMFNRKDNFIKQYVYKDKYPEIFFA